MTTQCNAWRQASAYDYWDELTLEALAWEFLRRNPDYRRAFETGHANPDDWGLRVVRDPKLTGSDDGLIWNHGLSASELLVVGADLPATAILPGGAIAAPRIHGKDQVGTFATLGNGRSQLYLTHLTAQMASVPLSILVPLDNRLSDRIVVLQRLCRLLNDRPAPDTRLTTERRRRLRQMARAADGQEAGASHKEIAEALFGRRRLQAEAWKTSSTRYATQRLIRGANAVIHGGYLEIFHSATKSSGGLGLP